MVLAQLYTHTPPHTYTVSRHVYILHLPYNLIPNGFLTYLKDEKPYLIKDIIRDNLDGLDLG